MVEQAAGLTKEGSMVSTIEDEGQSSSFAYLLLLEYPYRQDASFEGHPTRISDVHSEPWSDRSLQTDNN